MFLANLLVDTGQVEKAIPLLRDALKANPNYAPVHLELGYACRSCNGVTGFLSRITGFMRAMRVELRPHAERVRPLQVPVLWKAIIPTLFAAATLSWLSSKNSVSGPWQRSVARTCWNASSSGLILPVRCEAK